ncbi:hypothetical protein L9F63_002014 [Diploptera punctata]|uniref:Uncharacterized protein n=1 Tax=Diploptera punctata TaxID=6984 RepID=A0AAD8A2Y6_DIPPU|nr:hypothetical protein L9F63_002014 [Diploptera punctata]
MLDLVIIKSSKKPEMMTGDSWYDRRQASLEISNRSLRVTDLPQVPDPLLSQTQVPNRIHVHYCHIHYRSRHHHRRCRDSNCDISISNRRSLRQDGSNTYTENTFTNHKLSRGSPEGDNARNNYRRPRSSHLEIVWPEQYPRPRKHSVRLAASALNWFSHLMDWLTLANFWPTDSLLFIKKIPWTMPPPVPPRRIRCNVIEPEW